jgi:MEDS: MEthanogen/methylotroph, DcmR Sensory domain
LVKVDAGADLLNAIASILRGNQYLSTSITARDLFQGRNRQAIAPLAPRHAGIRHEVAFYFDDERFVAEISRFIGPALKKENAAVVVATALHRQELLRRLRIDGFDVDAAIEQGRYLALDATEVVSSFMDNDLPDPVRFLTLFGDLIARAAQAAKTEERRVTIFGEGVSLLWKGGNLEATMEVERLSNVLSRTLDVDILCGYSLQGTSIEDATQERICAEHSAICSV